jgi:beta-lactamase regulating signal transducer with metallopeptidase domain
MMNQLFLSVLKMSLASCYIILFVLGVRLLLKRAPKIFSYALWSIVFLKLVCPFSFESMISLIPKQVSLQTIENTALPQPVINSENSKAYPNSTLTVAASHDKTENSATRKPSATAYLPEVWLMGMVIMIIWSMSSFIRLKIRLSTAIRMKGKVYESERIHTPFVMGIIRPKIFLPIELTKEEKEYIVSHEQVHLQRHDDIIKTMAFMVCIFHWFNPLVWLSYKLMNRDMEMSCDEKVIKKLGNGIKRDYSNSLLSLASDRRVSAWMPVAFGENDVKNRIKNVLDYKKPALWIIITSGLLVGAVCLGLFFNPSWDSKNEEGTELTSALDEIAISHNEVTLSDQTKARLELVVRYDLSQKDSGYYSLDEIENGIYELQLIQGEETLDTLELNKDWGISSIRFSQSFDILFHDYNHDSCPDFTVGSLSSSNATQYYLYTITKDGKIKRICENPITELSGDSSIVFEYDQEGTDQFLNYYYDNETGTMAHRFYSWDADTGYFVISKEVKFDENGEAIEEEASESGKTAQDNTDPDVNTGEEGNTGANGNTGADGNTDADGNQGTEGNTIEDYADEDIMNFLQSPNGKLLKETTDSFVIAYFSNNKEAAFEYLSAGADYDSYVYQDNNGKEADVYEKLTHLLAKWYTASEKEASVQYEYEVEGEDSFTYLDLEIEYKEGKWMIKGLYLEK